MATAAIIILSACFVGGMIILLKGGISAIKLEEEQH